MRRILFVVGWAVVGAAVWAIILGTALLFGSDEPADFFEQATFRTEKVGAVAGSAVADGPCGESKDGRGLTHTHGTSYEVDLTWVGADGEQHHGVMSTCDRPEVGEQVTVWVSSRDQVFNRSPFSQYVSIPIAAVVFGLGALGWAWLSRNDRRPRLPFGSRSTSKRLREVRRRRSERLEREKKLGGDR
ncbi:MULTISPECIES: hypothetical protein [Kribbella]|uniref:DUF3592 domain-containing protein n=1 Tax=Kribbella karoonensis TaxID=324851 RepID=A0ABN2ESU6_9ACTN